MRRVAAALGGVLVLALGVVMSLGTALVALAGMGVAALVARWRKRPFTRVTGWIGAATAAAFALAAAGGYVASVMPAGTFDRVQHVSDSVTAARRADPSSWEQRVAPTPRGADSLASRLTTTRAFRVWSVVMGGLIAFSLGGALVGTMGWGAGMLLAYAASGRWIESGPPL